MKRKSPSENINTSTGEYILDCMRANARVGTVYNCPNCHGAVSVEQCDDEEQVTCNRCGLVAIDGCIVVPGKVV
jgi:uncharacterized paraquat-inducible protein A